MAMMTLLLKSNTIIRIRILPLFSVLAVATFLVSPTLGFAAQNNNIKKTVSIVTGSRGYLGRQVINELLEEHSRSTCSSSSSSSSKNKSEILCLVREKNVDDEQRYWDDVHSGDNDNVCLKVMPYDMLDGGKTISQALEYTFQNDVDVDVDADVDIECCVYHIASIFTPTEDHYQMALDNVKGTEDLMNAVVQMKNKVIDNDNNDNNIRVVVTSSTAAVRGPNQTPQNGKYYTHEDWNTASEHGRNWGHSYQWSKAQSERIAWDISNEHDIPMTSLAPSFIFGPPNTSDGSDNSSSSYSIKIINSWIMGEAPVQSRLCVDIRDVARTHVLAGTLPTATTAGQRIIVSSEARISSEAAAEEFRRIAKECGFDKEAEELIRPDTDFDGGAIKIGDKEVDAEGRLKDILGLVCRPAEITMADMARKLFEMQKAKAEAKTNSR